MISVIVSTSPGRETQLQGCLELLTRQQGCVFEVIVCDDGSIGCQAVCEAYASRLSLNYLWRANDQCPGRSRNLGAADATYQQLVFIDSDVLLNPNALAAYTRHLQARPEWLIYGYVGYEVQSVAPSVLLPERTVNWRDPRFGWIGQGLRPADKLYHSAYECAFAGNFAVSRQVYQALSGFDERFRGWGGEDLDFGERAVKMGYQIHFLLDAWAEHQLHQRSDLFHLQAAESRGYHYVFKPHPAVPYCVCTLADPEALRHLEALIQQHYLKTERQS